MAHDSPGYVRNGNVRIAVHRWGEDCVERPKLLLVHGTGFCGPIWQSVAESLANEFEVYAVDRRGHGRSSKPRDAYHFLDFAEDLVEVIDYFDLVGAYGVGHSAGATDLLLAAAHRPAAFRRLFAMEPTVMDPTRPAERVGLSAERLDALARATRRRSTFPDFEDVVERYRTRPAFLGWRRELLELYVRHGFEQGTDGSVQLCCAPPTEVAMLVHIYAVMEHQYKGDDRGHPFALLKSIDAGSCCISTAEHSGDIYKKMAQTAGRLLEGSQSLCFEGAGHSVAQEKPEDVVSALRHFWDAGSVRVP